MKKTVAKNLIIGALSAGVVLSPLASQYSDLSTPVSASTTVFQEDFSAGLSGWANDWADIGTVNGNKYAHIQSGEHMPSFPGSGGVIFDIGFLEKNISGIAKGKRYKITFRASGVGNFYINRSETINVNTGGINMNSAQSFSYEGVCNSDVLNLFFMTFGTTMGVDDIKLEVL
ncbi:hypothetical protein HCA69_15175 [Listeria grandensis]|uniref:DUF642 domain-containing protein n=1 Tax=Listeria grandensis TaxID=1494963 RepID=A0A7X0Y670_9LIST|nr:hypothetical protein [Listeria grandensis]MBC1937710.1 hypothetical protein [Listeria grandensis]